MRYQFVSAAILASISSVFAQTAGFDAISVPTNGQAVSVGDVLDITWAANALSGTVTIKLLEGASPSTLSYDPVVIATSINNLDGQYKWTVPVSVGSFATYGIAIFLDSDASTFQWSFPFVINAAAPSSSSVIVSTTASSSVVASKSAVSSVATEPHATISSTAVVASSISSVSSSSFSTVTTAIATPAIATLAPATTVAPTTTSHVAPSTNGTAANGTYTAPSGSNVTLSTSASATKTGSGIVTATGNAASSNMATGSFALLSGLFAAFIL
ncbi:hypothetical protein SBOR_1664 [Sclerotinia borealis F-4128]|uniref:Yeast cell wall synthesis Kre9/Knh1-like N-terminal domain-containing protein n=1 Tax=Sclerotinia borealis (strain F-4128) TaxID=1432307 RepID=W9CQ28_SCLBF|nr:hypothetical protein SBOR_1664 [Sclerotinia borealis F-4128]